MSKPWIKMTTDLRRHPKVVRISSALNADRLRTVGALHAVWAIFDEHSADGDLPGYTTEVVDDELRWPGFAAQMARVGWLLISDDGLRLPEFDTHNGASAKRRAQEADRKRSARASASDADTLRTRGEERRGEKSIPPDTLSTPPARAGADAPPAVTGSFEGQSEPDEPRPPATATPAGACAIALTRAGFRCTPLNPELLAYIGEGGTPEHLTAIAAFPECRGKKAGYVLAFARRELAEPAATLEVAPARSIAIASPRPAAQSRTAGAITDLEGLRRGSDAASR